MNISPLFSRTLKLGTQYPCPRAMDTAREHGRHFGHPCSRPVDTGVIWTRVFTGRGHGPAREHGPWTRVVCTEL